MLLGVLGGNGISIVVAGRESRNMARRLHHADHSPQDSSQEHTHGHRGSLGRTATPAAGLAHRAVIPRPSLISCRKSRGGRPPPRHHARLLTAHDVRRAPECPCVELLQPFFSSGLRRGRAPRSSRIRASRLGAGGTAPAPFSHSVASSCEDSALSAFVSLSPFVDRVVLAR